MKTAKRALAVLLSLIMILSVMPLTAYADNTDSPIDNAVEAIEANELALEKAEKEALETREEQIKNNTVEVTSGSNKGFVLENGKTYVFKKDVKFTNSAPSGSAITVPAGATATLQIEKGVTVTAIGADSETPLGAGAGINVPESATLIISGEGTLKATGGNAAKGEDGSKGEDGLFNKSSRNGNGLIYAGNGGGGGAGGGGAGAGIGGIGGNGGLGGAGGIYTGSGKGKNSYPYGEYVADLTLVSRPEGSKSTSNLFDNGVTTDCVVSKSGTISVVFRTSKPEKITAYRLVAPKENLSNGGTPSGWTLYGSDDSISWEKISTVDSPKMSASNLISHITFKYNVDKSEKYLYYRLDLESTEFIRLSEVSLYREEADHGAIATEPSQCDCDGVRGKDGNPGKRGTKCGNVYILERVSVIAKPGKKGADGTEGDIGKKANDKGSGFSYYYYAGGGGGGGGGAGGESPAHGIGAGGDGGAGGGGGGSGSTRYSENNDYSDTEHGTGGIGGNGYSEGSSGKKFGSQRGGDGGDGAERLEADAISGNIYADYDATVDGRLEGDIERGVYSVNEDGAVVDMAGIPVTDIKGLSIENNNLYRFKNNISYNAPKGENAVTIPENSKVIFEIPRGIRVTLIGGDASGINGAGAGIYVPESSTLIIRGSGTLVVRGGNAANPSDSNSGGGAGAAIGGKGGDGISKVSTANRGTDCGTVYILGTLKLTADPGRKSFTSNSKYTGGKAPDYGIGGGGAGGNMSIFPVQLSGRNGDVYIDFASKDVSGREAYFHRADLYVDLIGNVRVNGYSDMILGNSFSENVNLENLYKTLREAANHGALKQNTGWEVVDPPDKDGIETRDDFNGAYRKGYEWNKDIIDNSGGYVYLFATYFGRYIKKRFDSSKDDPNPAWIVRTIWSDIKSNGFLSDSYINDDMETLMSEILYFVHYTEPFDGNREKGYTEGNPTNDSYSSKKKALQQIDYSYTSVLDRATARYATFAYDTERTPKSSAAIKSKYYYRMKRYSFVCVDGYKGVTSKNWMNYIPSDASVGQLNMPGTHDSGTFNVGLNWKAVETILANLNKVIPDYNKYVKIVPAGVFLICALAPALNMLVAPILALFTPLFTAVAPLAIAYAAYLASNIMYIYENIVKALAQCNNLTIDQQLNAGIRTFDVRMIINDEKDYKKLENFKIDSRNRYDVATYLKVCHGSLAKMGMKDIAERDISLTDGHNSDGSLLTLKNIIEDSLAFVKENPSESVFVTLKCEGDDINKQYSAALDKVFEAAKDDSRVIVLNEGQIMPTVGQAAGKVYLIKRSYAEFREDHYDVSAEKKIKLLRMCFSESNDIRQTYEKPTPINETRMIYSSTYDYGVNKDFFLDAKNEYFLSGSPEELATGLGEKSINTFLDTYGYQRGQVYGWIYMNFPTQMATSNIYFSNIFDLEKLVKEHNEGSLFTDFNGIVFFGIIAIAVPLAAIPIIRKRKAKKESNIKDENDNDDEE